MGWKTAPLVLLMVVLGFRGPVVRADSAETEFRLKAIDVPPELRTRIHKAIDRAVLYLQRVQKPGGNGSFTYEPNPLNSAGLTALCGLACRHAGTPEGLKVAALACRWLAPDGGRLRDEAMQDVYNLSLSMMLLDVDGVDRARMLELSQLLAASQSPSSGWWGYLTPRSPGGLPPLTTGKEETDLSANLSTTQFAGLGLWAAHARGARLDPGIWTRHLLGLVRSQWPSGSWGYEPGMQKEYPPYPCGTFMGTANLALCVAALGGTPGIPADDREKVSAAVAAGRRALDRDGSAMMEDLGAKRLKNRHEAVRVLNAPCYELFALEKACILTNTERLGGIPWYSVGAEVLVGTQNEDGGWGMEENSVQARETFTTFKPRSRPENAAFAILFLVRAPEAYRTSTPRPLDIAPQREISTATAETLDLATASGIDESAFRDLFDVVFRRFAAEDAKGREARAVDFVRMGTRSIPFLVIRLKDEAGTTRAAAIDALRRTTGETRDFDSGASAEARAAAVMAWEGWWLSKKALLVADVEKGSFREP